MTRVFCVLGFLLGAAVSSAIAQGPVGTLPIPLPPTEVESRLFFVEQQTDVVYACQDLDSNGNCNGVGEVWVFYDSSTGGPELHGRPLPEG